MKIYSEAIGRMLSEEMDWENGAIGVGHKFRGIAFQARHAAQEAK